MNDIKKLKDMIKQERMFDFLFGLNLEFNDTCGRVLGKDPLPFVRRAFVYIQGEEGQKEVMPRKQENPIPTSESFA